jgi:hypothetical protein
MALPAYHIQVLNLLPEILKTEKLQKPKVFMEVICTPKIAFGPNMPRHDTRSTHTTQVCCVQALETRPAVAPSWICH